MLGGAIALGLLLCAFWFFVPELEYGLGLILGGHAPRFFTPAEAIALVCIGAGLGLLGSAMAVTSRGPG